MNNFPKIKANTRSLAKRKLVQGAGVNDAWFHVTKIINGKQVKYKPYQTWTGMIYRCYSSKYQEECPTYIGCTVCEEWLTFSVFEAWMLAQNFDGKALDKDIIKQGNKIYCPEYCRFVSPSLNTLLTGSDAIRGSYPMGVYWDKLNEKYRAQIKINGKQKYLGCFRTVPEAKSVYDKAKYAEIHRHALMQSDPLIRDGLMNWLVE